MRSRHKKSPERVRPEAGPGGAFPDSRARAAALAASLVVLAALAACAPASPEAAAPDSTGSDGTSAGYPVTVTNCGTDVTLAAPPERIVTVKSSATEMVLALGLGDRLVGTAFWDGPLPEWLAGTGSDLPVIAERAPSSEVVLELDPDLVYAGWESTFSPAAAGERQMLADLGVASYVAPAACKDPSHQPNPLTYEEVFREISEAGALLGVPEAAAELVAEQRDRLRALAPSTAGLRALWYSSGSSTPYVGAGIGAPQMILEAARLENIAADVPDTWASLSWEAVAERDPDVIVLVDASWNTARNKMAVLAGNATTAALRAVREERYLVLPFAATEAGVRSVAAAESLISQLAELEAPGGEAP